MRVIYWDVVFIINLLMNIIILSLTSYFTKNRVGFLRILAGACIGSVYLIIIFFPELKFLYTVFMKFVLSVLIIVVTFFPANIKEFLRIIVYFYLVSFMIGGGAFALFYFADIGAVFYNGIFILRNISIPWWTLLLSAVVVFISIKYCWEYLQNRFWKEKLHIILTIYFQTGLYKVKALIDTGNDLHDPISNAPVIVVEYKAIKNMLSPEMQKIFDEGKENDLEALTRSLSNSPIGHRFRLIPFTSLGKSKGMLLGFKPDKVKINNGDKIFEIKETTIGIYNKALSPEGRFNALLNPELLNGLSN